MKKTSFIFLVILVLIATTAFIFCIYKYQNLSFSEKYKNQIAKTRNLLQDDYSKEFFDACINKIDDIKDVHTEYDEYVELLKSKKCDKQYEKTFAEKSKPKEKDVVIVGGLSIDTRTEKSYCDLVGNEGKIIGFEPNIVQIPVILYDLKEYKKIISVYPVGLWKTNKTMKLWLTKEPRLSTVKKHWFSDFCEPNVSITSKFIKLDNFVKEKNIKRIDFIKLNVEGSELETLIGAKDTLKNFKPRLYIYIDHHPTQLFSIILYLDSLNLGYKFWLPCGPFIYASVDK